MVSLSTLAGSQIPVISEELGISYMQCYYITFEKKYSRLDQVKLVKDSL